MPNKQGIVFNLLLSNFTSLISKGIVIAKTKKNLAKECKKTSLSKINSCSNAIKRQVLIIQINEIKNIFKYGILRKMKGYSKEISAQKIIAP